MKYLAQGNRLLERHTVEVDGKVTLNEVVLQRISV